VKYSQRLVIKYIQTKFKVLTIISKRKAAEKAFELFCTPFGKSIPEKQPKNAISIQFFLDKKKVKGYVWNETGTQTLLILHGFGSAAYKFERYVSPAVKKGYRVLAFDAPAHGLSDGKTTHAVEYSQAIQQIVQEFGKVDTFIAHSFGGIAVSLALENMEHTAETKLVLIAPATETTTAINKAFEMLNLTNTDVRSEVDNIIYKMGGQPTEWYSINRIVKKLQAQILWLHDEDDDITPLSDALKVKENNHPNINFVITKGLGHRRIYHDATVKKTIIDFI
jgi:pimeloyl-ACP methyl ester carboxylesterase